MSKTKDWRIFRCFGSYAFLTESTLPSLPLHAGEQCCGTQGGARPLLCHSWLCCGSVCVALMSSPGSGEHILAESWPTGHDGDGPYVAPVFPRKELVKTVEFWSQLQSSWLWSIQMVVVSISLWEGISLIVQIYFWRRSRGELCNAWTELHQWKAEDIPGDPVAGIYTLVNRISLMIGCCCLPVYTTCMACPSPGLMK